MYRPIVPKPDWSSKSLEKMFLKNSRPDNPHSNSDSFALGAVYGQSHCRKLLLDQ